MSSVEIKDLVVSVEGKTILNGIYVTNDFGSTWTEMAQGDELLQVRLGQVLARRDGVQRDGPLAPVLCEIDHETHPVFAPRGNVEGSG